jgi:hypothetical protein
MPNNKDYFMKSMMTALLFFASVQVSAAQDSVAVFFNPQKTIVLINEKGADRLHAFMDQMGVQDELHLLSQDKSIKIDCRRYDDASSCTFRLLPSPSVQIGNKEVTAELTVNVPGTFETSFESSRGDKFILQIADGKMFLHANKKK